MGDFNTKYDFIKIYNNLKNNDFYSEPEDKHQQNKDLQPIESPGNFIHAMIINNNFNSFYSLCIASKQTNVVVQNKPMNNVKKKLDKVHVDLWGPHHLIFLSKKTYTAILLDTKTWKSWIAYLCLKDKFVDVFQI